jgi:hypothetical protein
VPPFFRSREPGHLIWRHGVGPVYNESGPDEPTLDLSRRMDRMPYLSRILVVMQALLLVLPPGWCCMSPAMATATRPIAEKSCCQQHENRGGEMPGPCRRDGQTGCCCPTDALAVSKVQARDESSHHAVILLFCDATPSPAPAGDRSPTGPSGVPVFPGPSLQILHCVWRC